MHDDIAELLTDPDFVTDFIIEVASGYRTKAGRWIETLTPIERRGTIQPASYRDTQILPEGDQSRQAIKIWSAEYLSTSDERVPKLGDKIKWHGDTHRVVNVKDWSQYGYWQALAVQVIDDK